MTLVTDHASGRLERWAHRRLQRGRCAVLGGLLVGGLMLPLDGLPDPAAAQGPAFLVKDINTIGAASHPSGLTDVDGTLFFAADDGSDGVSLWKSDGTATGTVRLHPQLRADSLTNVNGTLFFNDVTGAELWKSDGTEAGTTMVKDLSPTSSPFELTDVNGTLFFVAIDQAVRAPGLWKSDGTEIGTVLVKEIHVETCQGPESRGGPAM